jgi:hypothetical protein
MNGIQKPNRVKDRVMKPKTCTLAELLQSVNTFTEDDREVAVIVAHLVNSGKVRLRGNFAGVKIRLSPPQSASL